MLPSRSFRLLRRTFVLALSVTALGRGVAGCAKKPTMHVNHAEVSGITVALGLPERLSLTELPRGTGFDQQLLRDLRTSQPDMKEEPAAA